MHYKRRFSMVGALAIAVASSAFIPVTASAAEGASAIEEGKELAFSRKKGNCLACHMISGGKSPGNIAPPLVAMKARYPEKKILRAQIWDATAINGESPMPPFGRHRILAESEIDKVVEFIWSL